MRERKKKEVVMSKFEVKGVKSFPGHDGMKGFSANLYCDGKKVCEVFDLAYGGCYEYRWLDYKKPRVVVKTTNYKGESFDRKCTPAEAKLVKHLEGKTYECPYSGETRPLGEDMYLAEIVEEYENEKRMKRLCRTKVMVKLASDKEDTYSTFKAKWSPEVKAKLEEWAKKNGETVIEWVNERYVA